MDIDTEDLFNAYKVGLTGQKENSIDFGNRPIDAPSRHSLIRAYWIGRAEHLRLDQTGWSIARHLQKAWPES